MLLSKLSATSTQRTSQCARRAVRCTELDLYLPHSKPQIVRTDEDTIALVRRLATHYPDGVVAGILNRQGRNSAYGHRFQADSRRRFAASVENPVPMSRRWNPSRVNSLTVQAAAALGIATSTMHRFAQRRHHWRRTALCLALPGDIRLTDIIKGRFSRNTGEGFLPMRVAMRALRGLTQTVLQRVKRGELEAIHVVRGKQKGLRIKLIQKQANLFDYSS